MLSMLASIVLPSDGFHLSPRLTKSLSLLSPASLIISCFALINSNPIHPSIRDDRSLRRGPSDMSSSSSSSFSTADGFLNVKEGVDDMIKNLANEPSVGLYFVQQHAHTSMPHLLDVKEKVAEKIHEVTLHTEDIEDSICAVRSMAEYGLPIADEMIKDINKSLLIMSTSQPKRGLIENPSWGFQIGKSSSGMWDASGSSARGSGRNYLSAMFNTAKQKASSLRWSQPENTINGNNDEKLTSSIDAQSLEAGVRGASTPPEAESDELPLSSHLLDADPAAAAVTGSLSAPDISSMVESYNQFKAEQELKLQAWLRESEDNKD